MPFLRSLRALAVPALRNALLGSALLGVALAQGDLKARIAPLLPDNAQSAQVLEYVQDRDYLAIQERIYLAARQDPAWFRSYLSEHQGQARVPYNVKFGVNERDYSRYVNECCKGQRLAKNGKVARIQLTRIGNKVVFQGGYGAEGLRGVSLDVVSGELKVPEGFSARPHLVSASDNALGLPPRRGLGWRITNSNTLSKMSMWANLTLVQLTGGGVLLSYQRQTSIDGRLQQELDLNLMYDKKQAAAKKTEASAATPPKRSN